MAYPGEPVDRDQLDQLPLESAQQVVLEEALKSGESISISGSPDSARSAFAAVPILRDATVLGIIRIDRASGVPAVTQDELRILESFALQAAVAINDAGVRQDPGDWPDGWPDELDELLEIDEEGEISGDTTGLGH